MDFADILSKWDQMQASSKKATSTQKKAGSASSSKKANAPSKEKSSLSAESAADAEPRINPMELWLRRYGTVDKDSIAEEQAKKKEHKSKSKLAALPVDATLDLHGLTQEEAWNRLSSFVSECESKKFKKILLIHGKGLHSGTNEAVLGDLVRTFIEQDKRLGTFAHPSNSQGGTGATWVVLKKNV